MTFCQRAMNSCLIFKLGPFADANLVWETKCVNGLYPVSICGKLCPTAMNTTTTHPSKEDAWSGMRESVTSFLDIISFFPNVEKTSKFSLEP